MTLCYSAPPSSELFSLSAIAHACSKIWDCACWGNNRNVIITGISSYKAIWYCDKVTVNGSKQYVAFKSQVPLNANRLMQKHFGLSSYEYHCQCVLLLRHVIR